MTEQRALPPSARRVQDALAAAGLDCVVRELADSTRSAAEAAAALGCTVAEIAKSLVFRGAESDRPVLVIASGSNRVDEKRAGELIGERLARADADFVRQSTGFAIGGVAPLGHRVAPAVLVDEDLLAFDQVWAAAGTPFSVFAITPADLVRVSGGRVARVRP
ncbi:MAG: YbaK/EbsC family protein [Ectothiorhodospiraceae bacterium]|nr:YbaK/EbsC family protein [Chromatiales bacterium]MCP5156331.1 YbaK/EbsC family protein [Ectothiorhodospiraceae bacterium]